MLKTVKKWLKPRLHNILGLASLYEKIVLIENGVQSLLETQRTSQEGKYIISLNYPPSRDYRPRWGYTHPPHQGLIDLFNKYREEYDNIFREMVSLEPFYLKINREFSHETPGEPGWLGGPINALDAGLLYYFVTKLKPKRYVEIGSGITTLFAARAKSDHNLTMKIVSIDPEPRSAVDDVCDEVIRTGLETANLSIFSDLDVGDIVLMDGSHRSFMNSDVTVFMLDVIPLLKPGVYVHVHDIHLPYDYPDMFAGWYWNEQYLLGTYILAASERLKIIMPSRFMSDTPELRRAIPWIFKDSLGPPETWLYGGSLWFTHKY